MSGWHVHVGGSKVGRPPTPRELRFAGPAAVATFYAVVDAAASSPANNSFTGTAGNGVIDSGAGTDTMVYGGARSGFQLRPARGGFTVRGTTGASGVDI